MLLKPTLGREIDAYTAFIFISQHHSVSRSRLPPILDFYPECYAETPSSLTFTSDKITTKHKLINLETDPRYAEILKQLQAKAASQKCSGFDYRKSRENRKNSKHHRSTKTQSALQPGSENHSKTSELLLQQHCPWYAATSLQCSRSQNKCDLQSNVFGYNYYFRKTTRGCSL